MKNKILILVIGIFVNALIIYILSISLIHFDVVSKFSKQSFEQLENMKYENNTWYLNQDDEVLSLGSEVSIKINLKPFIEAGLDVNKLEGKVVDDKLIITNNVGEIKNSNSAIETFSSIIMKKREILKYHPELDHFGLDLGNGNMFEWAKDFSTNDKDIVFVLNPKPFIEAGVNTEKLKDWIYAEITTMIDGEKVKVYKFLKPTNIK